MFKTTLPIKFLLKLTGTDPIIYSRTNYRKLFSIIFLLLFIAITFTWLLLIDFFILKIPQKYTTIITTIASRIGFMNGNVLYGGTIILSFYYSFEYAIFINQLFEQYQFTESIKYKNFCMETNILLFSYVLSIIGSFIIWNEIFNWKLIICSIIYFLFYLSASVTVVYIRFIAMMCNVLMTDYVDIFHQMLMENDDEDNRLFVALQLIDKQLGLRWKFENVFGTLLVLHIIGTVFKISMSSFVVCVIGQRGTYFGMLKEFSFSVLPHTVFMILLVGSIEKCGTKVRNM